MHTETAEVMILYTIFCHELNYLSRIRKINLSLHWFSVARSKLLDGFEFEERHSLNFIKINECPLNLEATFIVSSLHVQGANLMKHLPDVGMILFNIKIINLQGIKHIDKDSKLFRTSTTKSEATGRWSLRVI